MKPLIWKTVPQRIGERALGFLFLLLILFLLHALKPAPYRLGAEPTPCKAPVFVQIEGGVRYPGIYPFCDQAFLRALITKAGGLREGYPLPEDRPLAPNAKISVTKEAGGLRIQQDEIPSFFKITLGLPISLNTESEEGLTALPGIGRSMAKAIAEERARRGGFKSLDELMGITGIGPKVYARVKPHLTL
jgi:competence protein ComEA